jgi:hypothetical protein
LTVKLDNQAPSTGHSNYALGPYTVGYASGENLSFVSVYSPLAVAIGRVDGQPVPLQSGTERGLGVYSTYVALAAASSQTLAFSLDGTVPLQPGGWYVLDLPHQPVINQDSVSVVVAVPSGWQLEALGSGKWTHEARFNLRADGPARLRVQVRRTPWSSWLAPLPDAFPAPA